VLTLPCNEEYNLTKLPNDHIERVEPLENGRTLEGSDMLQVFCIATTEAEAEGVVFKILQTGITRESIFVVTGCSEMDHVALPIRELRRHVRIGLGIGASVGWFVGTAMIVLLASVAPPSTGEALLIPLNTALAGMVLGTVAGASGGFCRPRISPNLARHYEEEVRQGRVLISVELHDASNRDKWRRRLSGQAEWMFIIPTREQPEGRPYRSGLGTGFCRKGATLFRLRFRCHRPPHGRCNAKRR